LTVNLRANSESEVFMAIAIVRSAKSRKYSGLGIARALQIARNYTKRPKWQIGCWREIKKEAPSYRRTAYTFCPSPAKEVRQLGDIGRDPARLCHAIVATGGETIGSLEVVPTPGQTPGHVAFRDTRDGAVIAGDVFTSFGGVAVSNHFYFRFPFAAMATWDQAKDLQSAHTTRKSTKSASTSALRAEAETVVKGRYFRFLTQVRSGAQSPHFLYRAYQYWISI
jgi:hypothetical protein